MDEKRIMLKHFLAALAYRTQKALRDAPPGFAEFSAGNKIRSPHQLIRHMDSVLGYGRTFFIGGTYQPPSFADFDSAVAHFHEVVADLAHHLAQETELHGITPEVLLQGPFSDAMTHAGQLSLLRRLAGSPVAPENFIDAAISPANLGTNQPLPVSPDKDWPEKL
jgi:phosphatidylserine/phosphatidylglycerophosphate/cardiolipin synthase-like enzyme